MLAMSALVRAGLAYMLPRDGGVRLQGHNSFPFVVLVLYLAHFRGNEAATSEGLKKVLTGLLDGTDRRGRKQLSMLHHVAFQASQLVYGERSFGREIPELKCTGQEHSGSTPRSDRGFAGDMEQVAQLSGYQPNPQSRFYQELYQPQDFTPVPGSPGRRELEVDLGEGIHLKMRVAIKGRNARLRTLPSRRMAGPAPCFPGRSWIAYTARRHWAVTER